MLERPARHLFQQSLEVFRHIKVCGSGRDSFCPSLNKALREDPIFLDNIAANARIRSARLVKAANSTPEFCVQDIYVCHVFAADVFSVAASAAYKQLVIDNNPTSNSRLTTFELGYSYFKRSCFSRSNILRHATCSYRDRSCCTCALQDLNRVAPYLVQLRCGCDVLMKLL